MVQKGQVLFRLDPRPFQGVVNNAENVLALAHAKSLGAGEALLGNLAGDVCEGTGSNVFVVVDGVVVSAPLCRAPCSAPAAPPSLCISTTVGTVPHTFVRCALDHSSASSAIGDDGVIG